MVARTKPKRSAKRSVKRTAGTTKRITVEFPGPPPTAAEREQIRQLMGVVELAVMALARGVACSKQCVQRRKRR